MDSISAGQRQGREEGIAQPQDCPRCCAHWCFNSPLPWLLPQGPSPTPEVHLERHPSMPWGTASTLTCVPTSSQMRGCPHCTPALLQHTAAVANTLLSLSSATGQAVKAPMLQALHAQLPPKNFPHRLLATVRDSRGFAAHSELPKKLARPSRTPSPTFRPPTHRCSLVPRGCSTPAPPWCWAPPSFLGSSGGRAALGHVPSGSRQHSTLHCHCHCHFIRPSTIGLPKITLGQRE